MKKKRDAWDLGRAAAKREGYNPNLTGYHEFVVGYAKGFAAAKRQTGPLIKHLRSKVEDL